MKKIISNVINFFRRPAVVYVSVGFFGLLFFGFLQINGAFADPDAFYHAKISVLMLKGGIVHDFSWLAYTVLPQIYADHHFLYHIILLPFVRLFSPLAGIKIATAIINAVFVLLFYYFLRSNKVPRPFLFTLLLLSSAPFIFRIDLAKANGLSLVFIMLILFAVFRRKNIWLAVISFLYVWAYGGWPIGIFLAGIYFGASIISNVIAMTPHLMRETKQSSFIMRLPRSLRSLAMTAGIGEWKPLLATVAGSLAGLIINPYFPQNLKFYWIQIVQIALINYQSKIGVGAEWYKFDLAELMSYSGLLILVFIAGMMFFFGKIFLAKNKEVGREAVSEIIFFAICAGAFFVLTLKSCRNTEYFYPFAAMFAAFLMKHFWDNDLYRFFKKKFLEVLRKKFLLAAFTAYLIIMAAAAFGYNYWRIKSSLAQGFGFNYYKEAMEIAEKNSAEGDIIFHSDWDDWPMLFYHNDYNRYIVGLDATFMYKYSPELFRKWRDITWGDFKGDPYRIIKNDFSAALVFIAKNDTEAMDKYFKNDGRYELIYDGEGKVYKVK